MNFRLILILGVLIAIILPAGALTVGVSSVGGPPDAPTENVSYYISDARAAVNEQNWTSALLLSTRGLAYYPDNPDLLCLQGYTYRKMGQYQKSVDLVSRAIPQDPKPVRYANRGYGYLALGNYSGALADAQAGISLDPAYATNYGVEALALNGLGKNAEARAAIQQALVLEPESAHYRHVEGVILAAGGNCTGARDALSKSVSINPDYSLPYPGFRSAGVLLAGLNTSCTPARAETPAGPRPTQSSSGCIAVFGIAVALTALAVTRK
jgi:tetratricopeptide (TPR) repeat protein